MARGSSMDSGQLPLNNGDRYEGTRYEGVPTTTYGAGYSAEKQGGAPRKGRKKWLWIILALVLVCAIVAGVVGGVVGSRNASSSSKSNNAAVSLGDGAGSSASSSTKGTNSKTSSSSIGKSSGKSGSKTAATGVNDGLLLATTTDVYGNPVYPTTTGSAIIAEPTTLVDASYTCDDPYSFTDTSSLTVRDEHPLLIAPSYKWDCIKGQIADNHYLSFWNDTIFANASVYYDYSPTNYSIDGGLTGSGVLDVAREVQLRIKHFGYAWRMSNDTKWVDRAWTELQTAAGNSTTNQYFGIEGNNWNSGHFLDVGEFTTAFALGYDWFYDAWTEEQKTAIKWSIINLGLHYGDLVYSDPYGNASSYSWWRLEDGNWNCVCNNGLIMGALAIANEDPTGIAARVLAQAVPNSAEHCGNAVQPDGTWTETPNYWYFGTFAHAQSASSLLSATGSTQDLLSSDSAQNLSSLYHIYVTGQQGLFSYGDAGPNRYSTNANALLFYGNQFDQPLYTLYQRDRGDVIEPHAMFWFNPLHSGQYWDNLPLDHYFSNSNDAWVSMRSSWTDLEGVYVAMKSSNLTGHQTHGDLDAGDWVMDAMGERWAGELGSGDYLADGYFSSEEQTSERWEYYRKNARGQNTLVLDNNPEQNVDGAATNTYDSTGEAQDALVYTPANSSTALFTSDITSFYNDTTSAKRAIRLLNGRRQVLIQDEITSTVSAQWRMHTNATVSLTNNNQTATLTLNGKTLIATLLLPSEGTFGTEAAEAASTDPVPVSPNQPNPGVTVLTVDVAAGTNTISVLFNPQWDGFVESDFILPKNVAIDDWSLTTHES